MSRSDGREIDGFDLLLESDVLADGKLPEAANRGWRPARQGFA